LVVTCPCAFGIATPLAYELAVSALRKRGLYVRDGNFFDRAARVRRVVFDKTGTLTTGSLRLVDPAVLATLSPAQRQVLYELASKSGHPKSAAIARAVSAFDPEVRFAGLSVREVAGHGVEAQVGQSLYRLGDPAWALDGAKLAQGPVFSESGALLAVLLTEEVPRLDAGAELQALEREGYELWIASGDRKERVDALAQALHIAPERALSDLTPEDKRALIERLDRGDTLMIGDGVNDGPALSRALCAGTPAVDRPFVPARTDFYFLTPGLQPIRAALHMAKRVRRVVRRALAFATAYNLVAVALCYAGLMRPWLAAVLMPVSSILVLTYTALSFAPRSNRWKS
jgi:Cu2+-exporting ATPase